MKGIWDSQVKDATDPQAKDGLRAMSDKAVARLQRHCRDDQWSQAAIDCVRTGGANCTTKMTPDQAHKLTGDKLE